MQHYRPPQLDFVDAVPTNNTQPKTLIFIVIYPASSPLTPKYIQIVLVFICILYMYSRCWVTFFLVIVNGMWAQYGLCRTRSRPPNITDLTLVAINFLHGQSIKWCRRDAYVIGFAVRCRHVVHWILRRKQHQHSYGKYGYKS